MEKLGIEAMGQRAAPVRSESCNTQSVDEVIGGGHHRIVIKDMTSVQEQALDH